MKWYFVPLVLTACLIPVKGKIVYLNGTEVFKGFRSMNLTTTAPHKWISVFNPRNISNHSGSNSKPLEDIWQSENDEEEATVDEMDDTEDGSSETGMATRDTTVLSSIRGIWSDLSPILTVLSTLIGIFLMFVIVESPLSPLPVPPLPYGQVGPFPPTNMYPFGIAPPRNHYAYAAPQTSASYRIPRRLKDINGSLEESMDYFGRDVASPLISTRVLSTIQSIWPTVMDKAMNVLRTHIGQLTKEDELHFLRKELKL
ncbi:hypothetical protein JTE90_026488 [Oedothorax gibbosus]|uniref:Uncharacterized protein n=1 Tax=Oedothorax gibbosus TaxID=931172 RepID=A0AAV6VR08_9ARAC|nr:hypothetical protein JTE90_026488 [Oedothorax gibbosus]